MNAAKVTNEVGAVNSKVGEFCRPTGAFGVGARCAVAVYVPATAPETSPLTR